MKTNTEFALTNAVLTAFAVGMAALLAKHVLAVILPHVQAVLEVLK